MNFDQCEAKTAQDILEWSFNQYGTRVAIASSFGMEDMVLIDMASRISDRFTVFTLDTGRLPEETYQTMDRVRSHYGIAIRSYFPNSEAVERLEREKGFYSFKESLENRKECCAIRKVEPLKRALAELDAWVTGIRREQSVTRADFPKVSEDADHPPLIKINPLADWTLAQVKEYIEQNKVFINPLHKKNYPSIGCAPCTRPIQEGEDIRAGRWWWENPDHKECGLHRPAG
ncbi:MAG: phosphoadenylyl-sulfate reductase [Nitrospinaceae bacterium]|nr:phosphoadenylyl-sulfate reductase [Nitrospinaceae bacterium]NIR55136.1 phosphoadenylyl-sulfate reductase [Nitrospinaceae bacterium]NIS85556.1 phosphoadenylyl-sulfate reductase [Nitrospinaceae bacterium]NIT82390.1 phosphoadenylyl-sulfate reductase [Nitrospinaceae bacterium]NIU44603.1 phosphoadenylyl-sulfate reductase [Nitrospinaceae bacterium]